MSKTFVRSSVTYLIELDGEEYMANEFQELEMSAPIFTVTDSDGLDVTPSCEVYSQVFDLFYSHSK